MEFAIVLGLDIAAAGIIIYCMCAAARKGFLRTVVQMIAYVVIIFVASTVSRSVAPVIYNHFVEPIIMNPSGSSPDVSSGNADKKKNAELVASRADGADAGMTKAAAVRLSSLSETADAGMTKAAAVRLSSLSETADAASDALSDTASAAGSMIDDAIGLLDDMLSESRDPQDIAGDIAGEIADAALRPLIVSGITMVAFVIIFAVLSIIANIVLGMLGVINRLPLIGRLNALLGGVVGILQGILIVWMLALLLCGLLNIYPDGVWRITQETVDATHFFKYFVNPKLLGEF